MSLRNYTKIRWVVSLLVSGVWAFASSDVRSSETYSVVAHQDGAPERMSAGQLKTIFKEQKQRWDDRSKILLVMLKPSTKGGSGIIEGIFDMDGNAWNKYWLVQVFRGRGTPPKYFSSERVLQTYVAETPGAIGIVTSSSIDPGLRSVAIDDR